MDEAPDRTVKERALQAAAEVNGVRSVENLNVRSSGVGFYVDLHVKADPKLSLEEAHEIAAKVKYAILGAIPNCVNVLVHMEPYKPSGSLSGDAAFSLPRA
jgi:divalent metal cation (Fe/Co/Zn/Cd) transporter